MGADPYTVPLNLPVANLSLRKDALGNPEVYDPLRMRWVAFTPEERVRQHFVNFLVKSLKFPEGRLGNEISLKLNDTARRCDTVVYDDKGSPCAIIEYKAPNVPVTRAVFEQIMRYALVLETPWLIVSNGLRHFCAKVVADPYPSLRFSRLLPGYDEISAKK